MVNKNKLKGAIISAGFTQVSLAAAMGISKNTLSSKLNGRSPITTDEVKDMCRLLGITSDKEKLDIFLV